MPFSMRCSRCRLMIACCARGSRSISQPLVRKEQCSDEADCLDLECWISDVGCSPSFMSKPFTRRGFLKQLNCAAIGSSAILNTLLNLRLANSATAQGGPLTDNRALVCIFLSGGCDSFNVLVPNDS